MRAKPKSRPSHPAETPTYAPTICARTGPTISTPITTRAQSRVWTFHAMSRIPVGSRIDGDLTCPGQVAHGLVSFVGNPKE